MTAEARAEFERRMADPDAGQRMPTHREIFVAGAAWADAQRELMTNATRDHLVTIIHTSGQSLTVTESAAVADAILSEFRPVVSTRERLIEAIGRDWFPENWDAFRVDTDESEAVASTVDGILASGAVEDRAEVERAAILAYEERRSPSVMIESIAGEPALEWMAKHNAKVEAKALEAAAAEVARPSWHPLGRLNDTEHQTMHRIREWLVARAAGIREGRS